MTHFPGIHKVMTPPSKFSVSVALFAPVMIRMAVLKRSPPGFTLRLQPCAPAHARGGLRSASERVSRNSTRSGSAASAIGFDLLWGDAIMAMRNAMSRHVLADRRRAHLV